jgi:hypothetical protein
MNLRAEERETIDFVRLARMRHPAVMRRSMIHHANQAARSRGPKQHAGYDLLLRMGFRPGLSDFQVTHACGGFHGLFLELKAEGGKLKSTQSEFLADMHADGYPCGVAWGAIAGLEALTAYLRGSIDICWARGVQGFPVLKPREPLDVWRIEDLTMTGTPKRRGGGRG